MAETAFGIETPVDAAPTALQPMLRRYIAHRRRQPAHATQLFDVLSTSIDLMTDQIRRSRLAGGPPYVMVELDLHDMTVLDFNKAEKAIAQGYRAMMDKADILERMT